MSDHFSVRVGGHVRRHGIAYAALTVALAVSPVPSMAAELVTTADIANGAVTQPKLAANSVVSGKIANGTIVSFDIKDGTVGAADLAPSAKVAGGAKVIRYSLGSHDFATGPLIVQLPGTWSANVVAGSTWSAAMQQTAGLYYYAVPGYGVASLSDYRVFVSPEGEVQIDAAAGPGEPYVDIHVFRTVATSTKVAP